MPFILYSAIPIVVAHCDVYNAMDESWNRARMYCLVISSTISFLHGEPGMKECLETVLFSIIEYPMFLYTVMGNEFKLRSSRSRIVY